MTFDKDITNGEGCDSEVCKASYTWVNGRDVLVLQVRWRIVWHWTGGFVALIPVQRFFAMLESLWTMATLLLRCCRSWMADKLFVLYSVHCMHQFDCSISWLDFCVAEPVVLSRWLIIRITGYHHKVFQNPRAVCRLPCLTMAYFPKYTAFLFIK